MINCEDCKYDAKCCSMFDVVLTIQEAQSGLYKHRKIKKIFENGKPIGYVNVLTINENGSCSYFRNGLCMIHEYKPSACKNWEGCKEW